ncbi:thermonuclease family protein [Limnobacter humi]|uniref:Thermonuclease family protein n=1 Tax=Limnobacter humi TaxID=1778671 RepID=A0ABT1WD29_9BURK|nr:thermonuclease family protein [Limnobacter humi]MCQ8895426.1 thermonuclease family protein [Limnobacter humi]
MKSPLKQFATPANAAKLIAIVLALAGYSISPIGPLSGAQAQREQADKGTVYEGRVVRVADGDTLSVVDTHGAQHKIRLFAVDAPELKQAHGIQSQGWLADQVLNETVKVKVMDRDRYGREVGTLFKVTEPCDNPLCPGDIDLNLQLVQEGHAWWYRDYAKHQTREDRQRYNRAEDDAREQHLGLWARPNPQEPWTWRAEHRRTD